MDSSNEIEQIEKELNRLRLMYLDFLSIDSFEVMLYIDLNQLAKETDDLKYRLRIAKAKK